MATIVLSAVGQYFGGPIGSAIGAVIGQQIDRAIIGNGKAREGPRIKELDIQTSSYGTQVPAIFGAMRVAGTVIWATDLVETRQKSGGGKNRPSTINYSYSASFAVALSSRRVARIGRIWADGNLLRGAAGDFKSETMFRFYDGSGDQPLDSLLASAEAIGQCPAYRGLAYAVFEDFQLADFGNRIPSLTFELFEREEPVPFMDIAVTTSGGAISGTSAVAMAGFAAQGSDCRSAIEPLISALPVIIRPFGDTMAVSDWNAETPSIGLSDPVLSDGGTKIDRPIFARDANSRAPSNLAIRHYEPQRDFQTGVQTSRSIGNARNKVQIDLPAAIGASDARNFAEMQLLQRWRGLNGFKAALSFRVTSVQPGDQLAVAGNNSGLRIVEVEHQRGSTRITARDWIDTATSDPIADPGRSLSDPDLTIGGTRLMLVDLPAFGAEDPGRPTVVVAAAGTGPGWRRAALSMIDGNRIVDLGGTKGVATMGQLIGELPSHTAMLEDTMNQPVVGLLHDNMILPTGSGDPYSFDAPALWLGGEIVRYGNAEKIAPQTYRLTGLLRGCFGTNSDAIHPTLTEALLIELESLLPLVAVPTPVDISLTIEALGIGDLAPVARSILVEGSAIRPPKPVHGAIEKLDSGDIQLRWQRRDRLVHGWVDGTDIPNSDGTNEFEVQLFVAGALVASWSATQSSIIVTASEISGLAIEPSTVLEFRIVQVGRFAKSPPLALSVIWQP
jgi:Putative phage tail protein